MLTLAPFQRFFTTHELSSRVLFNQMQDSHQAARVGCLQPDSQHFLPQKEKRNRGPNPPLNITSPTTLIKHGGGLSHKVDIIAIKRRQ